MNQNQETHPAANVHLGHKQCTEKNEFALLEVLLGGTLQSQVAGTSSLTHTEGPLVFKDYHGSWSY